MELFIFGFSPETRATTEELRFSIDDRLLPSCPEHGSELAYLFPEFSTPSRFEGGQAKFRFTCTGTPAHYQWITIGRLDDSGLVVFLPEFTWLKQFLAAHGLTL